MSLDREHLEHPYRSYGMDHARYDWSMLSSRKPVSWPGGMTMPYPDLRHFTLRDCGNRVGIYRFLQAFDRFGIKATFAFNTELAERLPYLLGRIVDRGELIAMPLSNELEERFILMNNLHSEQSWLEQACDACDFLLQEAAGGGGRILALGVHPWMPGQPHRIGKLEEALGYISSREGVWSACASEIAHCWRDQQE